MGVNKDHNFMVQHKIGVACCTRAESTGTKIDYKCNRVRIIVVHIWKT